MSGESKSAGQLLYETDVAVRPNYHDGKPRKSWEQLDATERWSWERPVVAWTDEARFAAIEARKKAGMAPHKFVQASVVSPYCASCGRLQSSAVHN
jgi:hypothetical protein